MLRPRHIALLLSAASTLAAAKAAAAPLNELSVSAGIDSAYDGNVYNSRGADFVNRITPHGSYRLIDPRVKLEASYDFSYWTYALGKADNSLNHRADVGVEGHPTRRLTLKVADEFSRAEDPGFLSRIGVVAPQIGIFDNVADGLIGINIVRRVFADLGYTYHWARFDPYSATQAMTFPALYDGAEHDLQGFTSYSVTRRDDLRFAGRFQLFTAGPQATDANRWDIGATYSPTLGWRHQFLPELEATADAGPLFYDSLAAARNIVDAAGNSIAPQSGSTWRGAALLALQRPVVARLGRRTSTIFSARPAPAPRCGPTRSTRRPAITISRSSTRTSASATSATAPPSISPGPTTASPRTAFVDWRVIDYFRVGAYYTLRWQETGPARSSVRGQFPSVTRNIVGIRLLAVLGADARPPRREVHRMNELGMARCAACCADARFPIIATAVGVLGVAAALIYQVEPGYKASAVIRAAEVQPAKEYVAPTVAEQIGERLKSLRLAVMARPIVLEAANGLGLFRDPKQGRGQWSTTSSRAWTSRSRARTPSCSPTPIRIRRRPRRWSNRVAELFMKRHVERREEVASATTAGVQGAAGGAAAAARRRPTRRCASSRSSTTARCPSSRKSTCARSIRPPWR